jgi:hypothetical protein
MEHNKNILVVQQGTIDMTLLLTAVIMVAFAGIYAVLLAMIGSRADALVTALVGRRLRVQSMGGTEFAASRRLSRA